MIRQVRTIVTLLSLIVMLGITHAQETRLQIVASHSILADVIENVAGDAADVAVIMPRGADPHSFQPTPGDLTTLADADVVFVNGALFEEGLMEAIENAGTDMNIITASSCVEMIAFGGHEHDDEHDHEGDEHGDEHDHEGDEHAHDDEHGDEHDHEGEMGDMSAIAVLCEQHYAEMEALHEGEHDHEDGEDHAHEEDEDHAHEEHEHSHVETLGALYAIDCGDGHAHEGEEEDTHEEGEAHVHDHGSCDPHVWMQPHNIMYWTMMIRDTLIELDAANAETYTANAAVYLEEVDALAHDFMIPMLESVPEENRVLITNHDSLGYLAAHYDFEVAITILPGGSTLAEPSSADIAAVIDLIREEGVPAVFAESTVNQELAQLIAAEAGAEVFVLYSGSLSNVDEPASTYLDYMRYNITTIVEALGGGL